MRWAGHKHRGGLPTFRGPAEGSLAPDRYYAEKLNDPVGLQSAIAVDTDFQREGFLLLSPL
jgi:hypothetical protein